MQKCKKILFECIGGTFVKKSMSLFAALLITTGALGTVYAESSNSNLVQNLTLTTTEQVEQLKKEGITDEQIQYLDKLKEKDQDFIKNELDNKIKKDEKKVQEILNQRENRADIEDQEDGNNQGLAANNAWGEAGDILVSYEIDSGSAAIGAGHAAIVSTNHKKTIESYAESFSPVSMDGVVYLKNEWKKNSNSFLGIVESSDKKRKAAAKYAFNQLGKPYNWNFFNKTATSKFYCSQLVWRSWQEQNVEIDGQPDDTVVTPIELLKSDNVLISKNRN